MDDEEDEIDLESQCRWCRKRLYARDAEQSQTREDLYELTHHWGIETRERTAEGHARVTDFVGEPFKLLGKFCSAKCLVSYVNERIKPDTVGESEEEEGR